MGEDARKPRILCIYGNPKAGGFVHGCIDHLALRLEAKGAGIDRIRLRECDIHHCRGCFNCLRTGKCAIDDDMGRIIESIRSADGLVTGASVRNGYFPALFKQFYERIAYLLGFGRVLCDKYVLGVGAVGMAGGKKHLRRLITFGESHAIMIEFLFFRVGIPTKVKMEDVESRLDDAADRFHRAITHGARPSWTKRVSRRMDDFVMRKWMFEPNSDHVYDYIISQWKEKGLMR